MVVTARHLKGSATVNRKVVLPLGGNAAWLFPVRCCDSLVAAAMKSTGAARQDNLDQGKPIGDRILPCKRTCGCPTAILSAVLKERSFLDACNAC
jgi:hypothetical protein